MRLIVQKYGGTSVGDSERIRSVARRLIETQREGCSVVAVISAMAGVTDNLIKLANETSPHPNERELDILLATGEHAATALTAMAVNALGGRAISLTGAEAGILTDRLYTKARIANITPRPALRPVARAFGSGLTHLVAPIERTGLRGAAYTVVLKKDAA